MHVNDVVRTGISFQNEAAKLFFWIVIFINSRCSLKSISSQFKLELVRSIIRTMWFSAVELKVIQILFSNWSMKLFFCCFQWNRRRNRRGKKICGVSRSVSFKSNFSTHILRGLFPLSGLELELSQSWVFSSFSLHTVRYIQHALMIKTLYTVEHGRKRWSVENFFVVAYNDKLLIHIQIYISNDLVKSVAKLCMNASEIKEQPNTCKCSDAKHTWTISTPAAVFIHIRHLNVVSIHCTRVVSIPIRIQ